MTDGFLRKTCRSCEIEKSKASFYNRAESPDGKRNDCKECVKARSRSRNRSQDSKDRMRDRALQQRYGISLRQKNDLLVSQGGRCAICRTNTPPPKRDWNVDHDHQTGSVRGIVCTACNIVVGYVEKGWTVLVPAVEDYLKLHSEESLPE